MAYWLCFIRLPTENSATIYVKQYLPRPSGWGVFWNLFHRSPTAAGAAWLSLEKKTRDTPNDFVSGRQAQLKTSKFLTPAPSKALLDPGDACGSFTAEESLQI